MNYIDKFIDYLLITVLLFFTVLPLFSPGFFPVHDNEQIGRLYELHKDVITGQFPPRLAQDLGFGFDYPLFNFYPSFVYYIAEIFHLFGFSFIVSTKLMIGLGFLLAGFFMYLFSREYAGRIGGIVSAIAYSYAPYHSVDVYVRGALPEFWSFVFVPAIFWSIHKLAKTNKNSYILLSAIFVACLILTHDLVAMISSFFLGIFFLYLITTVKQKKILFIKICASVLLGLAFSAYFWIPGYFEKQFTMVNLLTIQSADYHRHFVCIKQFFTSPWGYGGSVPGCSDGLSFQVGQTQLIFAAISLLISFFLLWKKKKEYIFPLVLLLLFVFSLFIQTKYSVFLWDRIPQFAYIQFPWRFLLFSDFTIALLAGYMFSVIKKESVKVFFAIIIVILIIGWNKGFFVPYFHLTKVTDATYTDVSIIRWKTSLESFEYVPRGIATKQASSGNTVVNISPQEIATNSYSVISGKMTVNIVVDVPQQKEFHISVTQSGKFRFNTYAFPGWKTFVDGKEVAYTDNNKFKLLTISLPKGMHNVRATFTETPVRATADGITLITVIGAVGYGMRRKKRS